MKKICVNKEMCIGCGACAAVDSNHFDIAEDGKSNVISNDNAESEEVQSAISACPMGAITIEEEK